MGSGMACQPGQNDGGGVTKTVAAVTAGGGSSSGKPDVTYKVADIILRARTAGPTPARSASVSGAPAPVASAVVQVSASGDIEVALHVPHTLTNADRATLAGLGVQVGELAIAPDQSSRVNAWVPASAIMDVAALDWIAAITTVGYADVNDASNPIQSEGVATLHADTAHANGVTGKGVVVGATSTGTASGGVDSLALSQGRSELPATCPLSAPPNSHCVFGGASPCVCNLNAGNGFEGTGMMEIVHDMAPSSDLVFWASVNGVPGHVNALKGLVAAGANVITEDLAFDTEPAFQRGMAAATIDSITTAGVPVHATTGNLGTSHAARVVATGTGHGPDGVDFMSTPTGCNFKPGNVVAIAPNGDTTFDAIWGGGGVGITLQWSEPRAIFPTVGQGGFTDLNLYVMDQGLTQCLKQSTGTQSNGQGDTIETVGDLAAPNNVIPVGTRVKIVVDVQGTSTAVTAPTLDLRLRGLTAVDATTATASLDPNSNFQSGLVPNVGATADGTGLNSFSAQGPAEIGLTTVCPGGAAGPCTGVAGGGIVSTQGVSWVARDHVSISGEGPFGAGVCPAPFPPANPEGQCLFNGTSAAAPHSAGCDALIRQLFGANLAVAQSYSRLSSTAHATLIDGNTNMLAVATAQGSGLLDCYAALGPPQMTCSNPTVAVGSTCQASVDPAVLAQGSVDPEGGPLTFTDSPTGPFAPGVVSVTVTGKDNTNLTASCTSTVTVIDDQPPTISSIPPQICALARQSIVIQAPTATDNCPVTLTGTILADATIPNPIPVTGGQTVTLPLGPHRVLWQANDGFNTTSFTQTIVVSDPPARMLANGNMVYTVTLPGRQAYVEAFVTQNGIQNVAGNIVSSGVDNGDGTFTYSRTVPASQYHIGDDIRVRFYSYQSGKPGVFTPGPLETIWFPDFIYGQAASCPPAPPPGCGSGHLTATKAVASSVQNSSFPASNAIDGNFSTRWSSAFSDPQWIYVDLGAPRFIDHVVLYWETAASANYDIQVSDDAVNWTTLFTETHGNGFTDEIDGLQSSARYVRMFSHARLTSFGNSLFELQVFGDPNPECI
jgi:hypothetical protein